MQSPLNPLSLDHWHKVLVAACFVTCLLAGAGVLKVLPAAPTVQIVDADRELTRLNGICRFRTDPGVRRPPKYL